MEQKIQLEFIDGHLKEAALFRPFDPNKNKLDVLFSMTKNSKGIPLSRLSCLLFSENPAQGINFETASHLEEIQTNIYKIYNVWIPDEQDYSTGIFGYSAIESDTFRYIFFPFSGIKSRCQHKRLGEILTSNDTVSKAIIDDALKKQARLRQRRIGEIIAEQTGLSQEKIDQTVAAMKQSAGANQGKRVGEYLVDGGLVTRDQIDKAYFMQLSGRQKRLGTMLVEQNGVKEKQVMVALASKFRLRFVNLDTMSPDKMALQAIPIHIAINLRVFPIEIADNRLTVAVADPENTSVLDALRSESDLRVELVVALPGQITSSIKKYYPETTEILDSTITENDSTE